ncbi:cytochrome P450 2F2-like [Takifugu rubripes]|uniref:cytochrome P450 2F2-like n=1 Tax=Takifugu rubripes TaxID=31033 RepID=UPI0011458488|nr:cytochrome P450 2F2-like [Takifugu rubripes]
MLVSLALLLAAAFGLWVFFQIQRPKNFPPGPPPIPLFGNLLEIQLDNPIADLERLAKRYGNVYGLFLGSRPAVVINGVSALKRALVNKSADFSDRAEDLFVRHAAHTKAQAPGVVLSPYNSGWREHRRFTLMTLRNFGLGKQSMEDRILGETRRVMEFLEQSDGEPINPETLFHKAASNIIFQVLFAKRFDNEDDSMKFFTNFFRETSQIINGPWSLLYDSFPAVRYLPLPFKRGFEMFKMSHERYLEMFVETKKTRVPGKPRHFVDAYMDELEKRGDEAFFSEDQLCAIILDLHFAGTDTTANTLLSGLLYLMKYPHIQEYCQQEIDKVMQGKNEVSFEDRVQMPYVQAVIHEIQRTANTVPLSVFHCTTRDTELMGYSIPKGTLIIPNLSSVLNEKGQWKSSHEFNPENFLNENGEFVQPEAFMPFSTGPRVCLGEGLARMELFIILVSLLRKFRFIWPEDAEEPDLTPVFGVTQTPKPYSLKVQVRSRC